MASHGPLLQFAVLAGFFLALSLTLLIAACEHPLRRMLSDKSPAHRARTAWWLLVTPAVAGIGYMAMTIGMPAVLHDSARFAAACSAHADSLWHVCVWHPSENDQSAWLWGVLALLAACACGLAVRAGLSLWRLRTTLSTMVRLSRVREQSHTLHVLDADQPLALACGILRSHVLVSRSLLESLDSTQLRVVMVHEQAHVAHRDVLYRLIALVLSSIQLSGTRRRLLRDLDLAMEQRCDFAAAEAVGSPVVVAETIVAVERMFWRHAKARVPLTMAFFSDFVPERVHALLSPSKNAGSHWGWTIGLIVVSFCALSAGWLHHITEFSITLLAR